ncbi:ABC transporter ATP-binding protein [uncultured Anaerococcus sp.]|uniref:ABC transporter ATP-binding protein n=1 Tax=uncultured Anaerococcus sp. TaxID=293428 RepID=UPI00261E3808|nr:ABC transporter ATP-binding protein [uncultured Anaerococcus sp.]
MTDAIKIKNLSKSFGNFRLGPLDLGVKKGTITGFIGENGAGKSTTIKLILDVIARDSGGIEIFGKDIKDLPFDEKYKVGFVYDDLYLPGSMKIDEIEKFHSLLYKNHWEKGTFYEFIDNFDLPIDIPINTFSRGMKMKLGLALAMSHGPEILILDEPTSGLDPVVRDDFLDILLEFIQDEDHTVLISSHILSDLEKIADYIAFIHKGELIFNEEKDGLSEKYGLVSLGDEEFQSLDKSALVGVRKHQFGRECLVRREKMPANLDIERPSIEDIMVYMIKEAYNESLDI